MSNYPNAWTPDEDSYLKRYYKSKGRNWLSERLGRTPNACARRARTLKCQHTAHFTKARPAIKREPVKAVKPEQPRQPAQPKLLDKNDQKANEIVRFANQYMW